jgi:hypothetical protein
MNGTDGNSPLKNTFLFSSAESQYSIPKIPTQNNS